MDHQTAWSTSIIAPGHKWPTRWQVGSHSNCARLSSFVICVGSRVPPMHLFCSDYVCDLDYKQHWSGNFLGCCSWFGPHSTDCPPCFPTITINLNRQTDDQNCPEIRNSNKHKVVRTSTIWSFVYNYDYNKSNQNLIRLSKHTSYYWYLGIVRLFV